VIDPKRVKERVFKALKSQGYQIKMYDDGGMATVDAELASRFYVEDPNLLIHVDEEDEEVNFNKNGNIPLSDFEKAMWAVKAVAKEYMYKFTIREYGKHITPKDFSYQTKKGDQMESVQESAMYGTKKTSRQMIENVCLVVKHKKEVDESVRGARSRNIQSIFLESNGERYKFPHTNLNGARAMARHFANGGSSHDVIGESIVNLTGKMLELREFYVYSKRNKLVTEDTTEVIAALRESINAIAGDLKSIYGKKSYTSATQRIAEQENFIAEDDDGIDYRDMFTVKKFDEKFEAVLPVVSSIVQERNMKLRRIEESSLERVKATSFKFTESAAVTFESSTVKMGHRLKAVALSINENPELATYIGSIGGKMISEGDISDFEKSVVKNVLENITMVSEDEPQDLISESVRKLSEKLTDIEDNVYDNFINEGMGDAMSRTKQGAKSFQREANDELMDLGTRLKAIQQKMKQGEGVEEGVERMSSDEVHNSTLMQFRQAVDRFEAARRAMKIAHKLKDKQSNARHQKQIMINMNKLRADVQQLEKSWGIGRNEIPNHLLPQE